MKYYPLLLIMLFCSGIEAQTTDHFQERQDKIIQKFNQDLTIVASETHQGRKNLDFYYLTGEEADNSILMLSPQSEGNILLFSDEIIETTFPAEIHPRGAFEKVVKQEIKSYNQVNVVNNYQVVFDRESVFKNVEKFRNINDFLVNMRIIKDAQEIEYLRKACKITAEGLNLVYENAEAGMTEKDLIEMMVSYFKEKGSAGASFYQAASGPHSVNIHFDATSRRIPNGDIIVFDIGAWYNNYTADISRTIPMGGKFSKTQKELYEVVLKAQKAAIERMKPGTRLLDVQTVAENILIEGLYELGLVKDTESEWQRKLFIQHGFYHFIGLHVHDVWYDYRETLTDKKYKPGMIMTMEPGVYFPVDMLEERPNRIKEMVSEKEFNEFAKQIATVYEKYAGMGVRIEDDVLITEDGNEVLTKDVPKEIEEIEEMMNQ